MGVHHRVRLPHRRGRLVDRHSRQPASAGASLGGQDQLKRGVRVLPSMVTLLPPREGVSAKTESMA